MFVEKVELDADAHSSEQFPDFIKGEVVFMGRSNVGKSSLLNLILGEKIARTSSMPGKTRSLLFFKVNGSYHFIDFPGYGYARVAKSERQNWQFLIDDYFKEKRPLKGIFLLIDSMIPNQRSDIEAFDFLKHFGDVFIVLTKIDRLKKVDVNKKIKEVETDFKDLKSIIPFSSITKDGLRELDNILKEIFQN